MAHFFFLVTRVTLLIVFLSWTGAQIEDEALDLLGRMTPEERVGQLFLVSFEGAGLNEESLIYDLLVNNHISGVILQRENDNFQEPETGSALRELVGWLHTIEYENSVEFPIPDELTDEPSAAAYVPPFIALTQEGNGYPFSDLLSEVTELPSNMAIGATWDPSLAAEVGRTLGQELASLGVNLYLGPSLDILEDPQRGSDLGVRAFGGDPFWVSLMGEAFISGFHEGSQNGIGVIAKHFPGLGSSDRPIEEEVATVRKSLLQLLRFELVPFLKVTGEAPGASSSIADGFLTSHIRYQGFQGNIRATTRPVSLDPEAYAQLLEIEPISAWRDGGGILISDSLGSRAVRRFYESLGSTFKGHLVARDAFLAGNDLLILSNFQSEGVVDQASSIRSTLEFFTQKYREDPVFAERVDDSVLRILRFKMRIFGSEFSLERLLPEQSEPSEAGGQIALEVARAAASLISPAPEEIRDRFGGPPELGERIIFISDVRPEAQCSTCDVRQAIERTALEDTVLRLYGTRAAGQVGAWNLSSYSMADLAVMLGGAPAEVPPFPIVLPEEMNEAISTADWMVFVVLDDDPEIFGSNALKMLLDMRPDLSRDRKVVVFAHDVPYYLDATEISKVDLYYALYSKVNPFIEVAARLLFQELPAAGAPPVSVAGIGYDLIQAMSPNSSQIISLSITQAGEVEEYSFGDLLLLQTGVIVDTNGNPVPDGTPVEFLLDYQPENIQASLPAITEAGIASVPFTLDRVGLLSIQARSEPANTSEILELNVQEGEPAVIVVNTPQIATTATQSPTETAALASATPEPTEIVPVEASSQSAGVSLVDLLMGVLGIGLTATIGHAAVTRRNNLDQSDSIRIVIMVIIGGLLAYNYLALRLPGSEQLLDLLGASTALVFGIMGGALGLVTREILIRAGFLD
jgi:beta-N-acetylhexosaminidase